MSFLKTSTLLWIAAALVVLAGFFMALSANMNREKLYTVVADYDACVAAGYPVLETYPEQCRTPDGRVFVNESAKPPASPPATTTSEVKGGSGCKVAGCSGQLCVSENEGDVITTCEYREEYGCYKNAKCEKQKSGKCEWTQTQILQSCLDNAQNSPPNSGIY